MTVHIGVDASNLLSGGAQTHLTELLANLPKDHADRLKVTVWANDSLARQLPASDTIFPVAVSRLNGSLPSRIAWQTKSLPKLFNKVRCDVLYAPGGTYLPPIRPVVTMSRNMLPFSPDEWPRLRSTFQSVKQRILRKVILSSYKNSDGIIFLTRSAKETIGKLTSFFSAKTFIIPHGLSNQFRLAPKKQLPLTSFTACSPLKILYVSPLLPYKNHGKVIEAVASIRNKYTSIELHLVGKGNVSALRELKRYQQRFDPCRVWLKYRGHLPHSELHETYHAADVAVFASSCENMPNTLLEMMGAGLPIACSETPPMPEILGANNCYFDPFSINSIRRTLLSLLLSPALRTLIAQRNYVASKSYTWKQCATSTFAALRSVAIEHAYSRQNTQKSGSRN